jgi:hypothetical protein
LTAFGGEIVETSDAAQDLFVCRPGADQEPMNDPRQPFLVNA